MRLKITIPRHILDDEDNLIALYQQLEFINGRKIKSIKAKGLVHTIIF